MKLHEIADIVPAEQSPQQNPTDAITMDIPLFIRLVEYAREDAKDDMALHKLTERLTQMSGEGKTLTMDDYDAIVGGEQQEQPEQMPQENEEVSRKQAKVAKLKKDYADKMRWSAEEKRTTGRDRSGHMSGALKIKAHLKSQYGVEV